MRNISSKTDNVGDVLPAGDFNINHRIELQSIVTDAGFSLDPEGGPDTDTDMLGKSLTVYANASQYYADTGAADAYEIDRVGNLQPLEQLLDGTIVYFKAANTNTGASTLDVDGIGVKDLVSNNGAALVGGEIETDQYVTARYNSATDDFEIISSANLITWKNYGYDFIPVTSGLGSLGSATKLVEALYLGDSKHIYLGDDQDFNIYHSGIVGWIVNNTGDLNLTCASASNIRFKTTNTDRWLIDSSGHLLPYAANTYNLGSTTLEMGNIYQGDSSYHYFGSDQDMYLQHTGAGGFLYCGTGFLHVGTNSAQPLHLVSNSTIRWSISATGDLLPYNSGSYNIGSSSYLVNTLNVTNVISQTDLILRSAAGASSYIRFQNGTGTRFLINSGQFLPFVDAIYDVGSASLQIDDVYCVTLVESSDETDKTDFDETLGLDFILDLQPKSYKMNKGKNRNRKHGLVAQEVLSSVEKLGKINADFAAVVHDEESGRYGLSYSQFIAPIIKSIQELNDKIESLIGTL